MCGPHASQSSSAASHPTYGPAKAVGRSQTRPVEAFWKSSFAIISLNKIY